MGWLLDNQRKPMHKLWCPECTLAMSLSLRWAARGCCACGLFFGKLLRSNWKINLGEIKDSKLTRAFRNSQPHPDNAEKRVHPDENVEIARNQQPIILSVVSIWNNRLISQRQVYFTYSKNSHISKTLTSLYMAFGPLFRILDRLEWECSKRRCRSLIAPTRQILESGIVQI